MSRSYGGAAGLRDAGGARPPGLRTRGPTISASAHVLQPSIAPAHSLTRGNIMMHPRSTTLGVGDAAPDFALADTGDHEHATLSSLRGRTVLLVFSSPHWDPARDELPGLYPGHSAGNASKPRVIEEHRANVARSYGVENTTALFVIDEHGVVRWRYVLGVDAVPQSSVATSAAAPPSADDMSRAMSRRDFAQTAMTAAALLAASTLAPRQAHAFDNAADVEPSTIIGTARVTLNVNGHAIALDVEPRVTLLDALRERAGLTGTKKGCDHGQCGACTVHVDGRRVLACMTLAVMLPPSAKITTIEGLATGDELHPVQQAFITNDAFQCGYCTSGQIMSACAMLKEPWGAHDDDVREAMSGNICRCGAYPGIVAAVQSVRGTTKEAAR